MTSYILGPNIPDEALTKGSWEVLLMGHWIELSKSTEHNLPCLIDRPWGEYKREMIRWHAQLGVNYNFMADWRMPVSDRVTLTQRRWACMHKRIDVDTQCPICKAFGRKSVTE